MVGFLSEETKIYLSDIYDHIRCVPNTNVLMHANGIGRTASFCYRWKFKSRPHENLSNSLLMCVISCVAVCLTDLQLSVDELRFARSHADSAYSYCYLPPADVYHTVLWYVQPKQPLTFPNAVCRDELCCDGFRSKTLGRFVSSQISRGFLVY